MEHDILKLMRQRHTTTQQFLTVKFYLTMVLIITLHSRDVFGTTLGSKCQHDMDCTDFIKGSSCSVQGYCECAPYYVQYNNETCLSSQLLGGDCMLSEQCTMKVANSSCLDGACRCVEGFLQFRKHTCLGPAPPGSVCYSHAHCQMYSERTHCDFLIPNLFGRCQCTAPNKLKAGLCVDNTIEEAQPLLPSISLTTTSTTPATVKETEAPSTISQEPNLTTPQQQVLADHIVTTDSIVQPVEQQPEENVNVSIEEQVWEGDKDIVETITEKQFIMQTESLTPAEVEAQHPLKATESNEAPYISTAPEDYPYKIEEEEEDHTQPQKLLQANDHMPDTSLQEEENVEDYGNVIDNTMNFDYETAQHETEEHIDEEHNSLDEEQEHVENTQQDLYEVQNQDNQAENNESHEQETERNVEQQQDNKNDDEVQKLGSEEHLNQYETEYEQETKTEQPEQQKMPFENNEEQHQIENEQELEQEQEQENIPVQEPEFENDYKENSDTEQERPFKHEQEKEQQQVHEEVNEEQETKPTLEAEQDHVSEQEHVQNEDLENKQEPDKKHEKVNESEEQDVGYQESTNEQELEIVHEPEQEQGSLSYEPEPFHEPKHEESLESLNDKVHEPEQSQELSYEEEQEEEHKPNSEEEKENKESHEATNEPESDFENLEIESDQEHKVHNLEQKDGDNHENSEEVEEQNYEQPIKEHKEIKEQNQDETQQVVEQQNKDIEHNSDAEQDYNAQPDHIIPASSEMNDISPKEQQHEDSVEENSNEKLNSQSITNEIHRDQLDKVAVENESVLNENEATTQQMPEALTLSNNEIITTQPAELQEEEKGDEEEEDKGDFAEAETETNSNIIDFTIGQEEQKIDAPTAVNKVIETDNEEEKFVSQEMDDTNTADQVMEPSENQQQEFLQQTTEKMSEVESESDNDAVDKDFDHNVFENFEKQNEDKQNEILTEVPIETEQINHDENNVEHQSATEEEEDTAIAFKEETNDDVSATVASVEDIKNQLDEHQNNLEKEEEEIVPSGVESDTEDHVDQGEIPENIQNSDEDTEEEQKSLEQSEKKQDGSSLENSKHVENNLMHQADDEEENVKENLNEVFPTTENGQDDINQEEQNPGNLNENTENIENPADHNSEVTEHFENQEGILNNEEDNLIESTTLSAQDLQNEIAAEAFENSENDAEFVDVSKEKDSAKQEADHVMEEEPIFVTNKEKNEVKDTNNHEQTADVNKVNAELLTNNEEVQQSSETFETNYVPSETKDEKEEQSVLLSNKIHDNEIIDRQPSENKNVLEIQNQNAVSIHDINEKAESEENVDDHQPENVYFSHDQISDVARPQSEEFKESESISDILNNLMKEDVTLQPQYSEESDLNDPLQSMQESEVPDLLAEDTNISEESVMSQQIPSKDSTNAPIDPVDKLITFYPDEKDMLPVPQQPIINTSQQPESEAEEGASGDGGKTNLQDNEIFKMIERREQHTLSPLDIPFDTSVDYQPQQFEADNLVVETTTISASDSKIEANNEQAEATTTASDIDELTTQTMLNLASRITIMEPAAPISTTLKPLLDINAKTEVTAVPFVNTPIMDSLMTTKPTTEIRKRVELGLEAVSLGLSCSNDKQCQLADPHTLCNSRGVCDCAANVYNAKAQNEATFAQCGAERTGCAPGTFQCRSSGVCISWFFVCDGRSDCNDASDEECSINSRLNQTCPTQAFQCGNSGRCISRAALCDGRKQCPHGEDEIGCTALKSDDSCPPHTFRCKSGECFPEYEYCNAIISCRDGSDEPPHLCGSRSMPNFFLQLLTAGGLMNKNVDSNAYCPHRCSNGRCRSTAIVCSGRDGCGDGTDEQTCSVCRCPVVNTERTAINISEFLAKHRPMPLW